MYRIGELAKTCGVRADTLRQRPVICGDDPGPAGHRAILGTLEAGAPAPHAPHAPLSGS